MDADTFPITHQTLIESHRQRYRIDAQAALDGVKEVRVRDDCGIFPRDVDYKFIEGMERRLPAGLYNGDLRTELCTRIKANLPVPELDAVLSEYVTRLTGRLPDGRRVSVLVDSHPLVSAA
ncbi:MAG: hypothetical protein JST44_08195 [Cyanobacteria bacterium SZAS LIN-5]|nr:hypothetical protein [Cyanobacteria bacterium SZAS LIN-5]RTL43093.1 MAG: hypothetical protein EKK48_09330 [Candidatus Melainabacteria bacterium]